MDDKYWYDLAHETFLDDGATLRLKADSPIRKKSAGDDATRANGQYRAVKLGTRVFQAHRLLWLMRTGSMPRGEIDHLNGNSRDNRQENLPDVSHKENMRNSRLRADNAAGYPGVSWHKWDKKWLAYIGVDGRIKRLGSFDLFADACAARDEAETRYGFISTARDSD